MAFRIPLFFFAAVLTTVQVNGQAPAPETTPPAAPPTSGDSGLPPIQADPSCTPLATKCLTDMPFPTGDTVYYLGKIYVSSSGAGGSTPPAAPPATGSAPPATGSAPPAPTSAPPAPASAPPAPASAPPAPASAPPAPASAPPCAGAENTCSITSYVMDTCQGIKILLSRGEDGAYCLKQAAYNKATNSVAIMKDMWLPASGDKAIIKQIFGYYAQVKESGEVTYVDPAPAEVKTSQAKEFVLLGAKKNEYALFTTCCKSVVFVLYSESVITGKTMQTYDAEISPLVDAVGIKYTDLKDVPTDMPTKLDAVFPAAATATATAAAAAGAGAGSGNGTPTTAAAAAAAAAAGATSAPAAAPPAPPTP